MASYTRIELDTEPPGVTFGSPRRYGDSLGIPYTVNEPGVLEASYIPLDQDPLQVLVLPRSFWIFSAPLTIGTLVVTTRDDVWNVGTEVFSVTAREVGGQVLTGRYRGVITGGVQEATAGIGRSRPEEITRRIRAYHKEVVRQVAYGVRIRKK